MSEGNVAIRLKDFLEEKKLSSSQFADLCGIPRPSFSQLLTGRNKKISDILITQIHNAFPDLSIMWLLFGEGSMLVADDTDNSGESNTNDGETIDAHHEDSLSNVMRNEDKAFIGGISRRDRQLIAANDEKLEKELAELKKEIEKLRKEPRKVSHITVYYEDSTFETFYPGGTAGKMGLR